MPKQTPAEMRCSLAAGWLAVNAIGAVAATSTKSLPRWTLAWQQLVPAQIGGQPWGSQSSSSQPSSLTVQVSRDTAPTLMPPYKAMNIQANNANKRRPTALGRGAVGRIGPGERRGVITAEATGGRAGSQGGIVTAGLR